MFDVTPEGANFWFDAFNVILFIGAFAVAVGTYGSIRMGSAKEKFADERIVANEAETKRAIADSDIAKAGTAKAGERIAELTTQSEQLRKDTAEANKEAARANEGAGKANERAALLEVSAEQSRADIAKANERAAEANARAAEAKLALEKFKAPRTLLPEQQERISEALKHFAGMKFDGAWSSIDGEIDFLFTSLEDALKRAGWDSVSFEGPGNIFGRAGRSSVGMANAYGVVIAVNFEKNSELVDPALALLKALSEEQIGVVLQQSAGFMSTNPNTIHILVGSKR
jgi:hypothetical protein